MKPLAFVTPNASNLAQGYQIKHLLDKLVERIESNDIEDLCPSVMERRYPYLQKRATGFRIIGKQLQVKGVPVVALLHVIKRGDHDFKQFNDDREKYGKEYLEPLLDHQALEQFVEARLSERPPEPPKEPLPDTLRRWLEPFPKEGKKDTLIMESRQWVERFEQKRFREIKHRYYDIICSIVDSKTYSPINGDLPIYVYEGEQGHIVYYAYFLLEEENAPSEDCILLLDAGERRDAQVEQDLCENFKWLQVARDGSIKNIDQIARHSKRSYYAFILGDEPLWRKVEEDDAANPALSAEEITILSKVRHVPGNKEAVLPLFINGRAGSGKSTMLYHLFADYLYRKVKTDAEGSLIFLTYTKRLLDEARHSVNDLLRVSSRYAGSAISLDDIERGEPVFWPFLDFLKSLVPDHERASRFAPERYVDFGQFQMIYPNLHYGATRLPADVAWHVIRTYIKGYKPNGYLTPEEYDDLPTKEKSVPLDMYTEIFQRVWPRYRDSNYWDSQDIVRYILENNLAHPKYAVVFCDEAQDFTRIELDLILRLLVYRKFDLGWERNLRIPFVMAGDPFQTLNPTGFRWEAIKAAFYDEIVSTLDPYHRKTVSFDYEELSFNYRSEAPIVKFSNLLQFWRKRYFGATGVAPQKPWRIEEHIVPPRLYILGKTISEDTFLNEAQDSVVIIPCEYGQEESYIQQDPLLSKLNSQPNKPLFFSPMQAKGLEFQQVILYGFGKDCPPNFFDPNASIDEKLRNEYFLNKLYVGVTRAREYLLIVDPPTGEYRLWKRAVEENEETEENIDAVGVPPIRPEELIVWPKELIGGITSGVYYAAINTQKEPPLKIAERLEKAATNPKLLRQASDFYRRAGEEEKAKRCEAKALELEKKFLQAGQIFEHETIDLKDAERCYWKGGHWNDLEQLYLTLQDATPLYYTATQLMTTSEPSASHRDRFLQQLHKQLQVTTFILDEVSTQQVIRKLVASILSSKDQKAAERVATLASRYPSIPPIIDGEALAQVYYLAHRYQEAVEIWEQQQQKRKPVEYALSKAQLATDTVEKINWYYEAGKFAEVVNLARSLPAKSWSEEIARQVSQAQEATGHVLDALTTLIEHNLHEEALSTFKRHQHTLQPQSAKTVAQKAFEALLEQAIDSSEEKSIETAFDWYRSIRQKLSPQDHLIYARRYLAALAHTGQWDKALAIKSRFHLKAKEGQYELWASLAREVAKSSDVLRAPMETKQNLAEFLLDRFEPQVYSTWKPYISTQTIGAAVEKVGKDLDALKFYEGLEKLTTLAPQERDFVRKRWLKVKQRQIHRQRQDMEKADEAVKPLMRQNIEQREKEMMEQLTAWGFEAESISKLPAYPAIGETTPTTKIRPIVHWQKPVCHISIESEQRKVTLMIDVNTGQIMAFPPDIVQINEHEEGHKQFVVPGWDIEGEVVQGQVLRLRYPGSSWQNYQT